MWSSRISILSGGSEESHEKSSRISSVPAEIRTEHHTVSLVEGEPNKIHEDETRHHILYVDINFGYWSLFQVLTYFRAGQL
jgi:hypothetical protein